MTLENNKSKAYFLNLNIRKKLRLNTNINK